MPRRVVAILLVLLTGGCAAKKVFVTDTCVQGDFAAASPTKTTALQVADEFCNDRARAASLGGHYKAWISTFCGSPARRFTRSKYGYELPSGGLVAKNWGELTDWWHLGSKCCGPAGSSNTGDPILLRPIDEGPDGRTVRVGRKVWTGTFACGAVHENTKHETMDCGGWRSTAGTGAYGNVSAVDHRWTDDHKVPDSSCSNCYPLYCFEQ